MVKKATCEWCLKSGAIKVAYSLSLPHAKRE